MNPSPEHARLASLAAEYRKLGYKVTLEPAPETIPFYLGNYRPDFLAEKGSEHLLISVKKPTLPISISRVREVAEIVKQQPGWRFLLVNSGLEPEDILLPQEPLSWSDISGRIAQARHLSKTGAAEAAILLLCSALEALLRRHAESVELPLEHLSVWALLDYLYSDADLSYEHFEQAKKLLAGRNQLAHGFPLPEAHQQAAQLQELLDDLASEWLPGRLVA